MLAGYGEQTVDKTCVNKSLMTAVVTNLARFQGANEKNGNKAHWGEEGVAGSPAFQVDSDLGCGCDAWLAGAVVGVGKTVTPVTQSDHVPYLMHLKEDITS